MKNKYHGCRKFSITFSNSKNKETFELFAMSEDQALDVAHDHENIPSWVKTELIVNPCLPDYECKVKDLQIPLNSPCK